MMGLGKPSGVAFGNGAKLAVVAIALPVLLPRYGLNAAMLAFVAAEAVRYCILVWRKRAAGINFVRQDIGLTLLFIALIFLFREASYLAGLTGSIGDWLIEGQRMHG